MTTPSAYVQQYPSSHTNRACKATVMTLWTTRSESQTFEFEVPLLEIDNHHHHTWSVREEDRRTRLVGSQSERAPKEQKGIKRPRRGHSEQWFCSDIISSSWLLPTDRWPGGHVAGKVAKHFPTLSSLDRDATDKHCLLSLQSFPIPCELTIARSICCDPCS